MKKIILLTAAVAAAFQTAVYAEFADMAGKDAEVTAAVELLNEKGYMEGKSESEFDPDGTISRAEFAAVTLRMLDCVDRIRPYYMTDVPKKSWYYYIAGSAAEYGIMNGYSDGTFRGDDDIQRVYAAVIAARVLASETGASVPEDYDAGFTDEVPEWAAEDVRLAAVNGIIKSGGSLGAYDNISRGEAALMFAKLYDKLKDKLPADGYTGSTEDLKPPVTIVIDPGHGKDSGSMSSEEKLADGWLWNEELEQWGEWKHWKPGTAWEDCGGCEDRGNCWYGIGNGDRDYEPQINLNNAMSAAKYLEEMGYEVRMARTSNEENPSMTKRLIYCYPNNDTTAVPDADLFVCLHSNAGGGRGSAYIELEGEYDQKWIPADYAYIGNTLGKYINDEIISSTSMVEYCEGKISGLGGLVLFCKSPVPIAYLEIGFYDNYSDLDILNSEYDKIGMAVAAGIDKYCIDTGIK